MLPRRRKKRKNKRKEVELGVNRAAKKNKVEEEN